MHVRRESRAVHAGLTSRSGSTCNVFEARTKETLITYIHVVPFFCLAIVVRPGNSTPAIPHPARSIYVYPNASLGPSEAGARCLQG